MPSRVDLTRVLRFPKTIERSTCLNKVSPFFPGEAEHKMFAN